MHTINRRQFLEKATRSSLTAMMTGSLLSVGSACGPQSRPQRPNIIYILADDLGYGDLSGYGQQRFTTPNLDQMAAEGIRFTNHYAGSTVCAPSRCALMTGYHTGHAWVRGNWETGPHGWGACLELRPEDLTIAELLKSAGYATGAFGKWSLGIEKTTGAPWKQGFDQWFGFLNQGAAHFYYPEYLWKNDQKVGLTGNKDGQRQEYAHDLIIEEALRFIDANQDHPFFLYLPVTIPHAELLVPEDSLAPFLGKFPEQPYEGTHYASQPTPSAAFAGMVTRMDRDIGRIFEKLKTLGIDENTIVMFSSDNGPHKEGGHSPDFFDSNGPLRGYKRDLYEGGIRVPMMVRWPGKVKPGTVTEHPSAFWDVLPTICDLAAVKSPAGIDGISFLPTLLGKEQPQHEYLYWEFHENPTTDQAIRRGEWKAVRHRPDGPIELYHLKTDPGEQQNVADEQSEIVAEMAVLFREARTVHEIWPLKG